MVKIQFEIVSPKKWLINRKVKKQEARVEKAQTKLDTLRAKQQKIYGSDEVSETVKETVTQKIARMTEKEVIAKMGNKIVFKRNKANRKYHAESGLIDGEFTEWAKLTKWLVVSPNPRKEGENRIFFNYEKPNGLFITQAKKAGFEVSFN